MIVLTGRIMTDPETLPRLHARLRALAAPSRAEDGCLFYHMAVEDADQGTILVNEGWRDQAALNRHLALPAIADLLRDFAGTFSNDLQIHQVSRSGPFTV